MSYICKEVRCIETGEIYPSGCQAARATKIPQSNIVLAVNNKDRTAGGYHWEYTGKETKKERNTKAIKNLETGEIYRSVGEAAVRCGTTVNTIYGRIYSKRGFAFIE